MKSTLGFTLKKAEPLTNNFKVVDTKKSTFRETWKPVWGERKAKFLTTTMNYLFL